MAKEVSIFASKLDKDEPTALSNYQGKPIPALEGGAAKRFELMARENEEKARQKKNKPITAEEAKEMLAYKLIMLEYERECLRKMEAEIKELKKIINSSK